MCFSFIVIMMLLRKSAQGRCTLHAHKTVAALGQIFVGRIALR